MAGSQRFFGNREARGADGFGQVMTDAEADLVGSAGVDEAMRESGRVGSGDDLHLRRVDRQLFEGHAQKLDVIGGRV
jgi:hypothetical protein